VSGANVNARNNKNLVPLAYARRDLGIATIRQILDAGADLHAVDAIGTLAHAAVINPEFVALLAEYGAPLELKNKDFHTPLELAIRRGETSSALAFIRCGVNPNARVTPPYLFQAIKQGNYVVVEALLEAGASPTMTWDGNTLHQYARAAYHRRMARAKCHCIAPVSEECVCGTLIDPISILLDDASARAARPTCATASPAAATTDMEEPASTTTSVEDEHVAFAMRVHANYARRIAAARASGGNDGPADEVLAIV
jgi:ankyrin repeat protein